MVDDKRHGVAPRVRDQPVIALQSGMYYNILRTGPVIPVGDSESYRTAFGCGLVPVSRRQSQSELNQVDILRQVRLAKLLLVTCLKHTPLCIT
jgi:hypothetical protein